MTNHLKNQELVAPSPIKTKKNSPLEDSDDYIDKKVPFTAHTSPPTIKKKKTPIVVVNKKPEGDSEDEAVEVESSPNVLPEGVTEHKNKNFSVKNCQFLLTYKTHIDKDGMKGFIESICSDQGSELKEFYMCHENGDTTNNYEHCHVYFKCKPEIRTTTCTAFDILSDPDDEDSAVIHPNIVTVGKGLANEWGTKYYLTKEDKSPDLIELAKICILNAKMKKFQIGGGKSAPLAGAGIPLADRVWACATLREALRTCCGEYGHAAGIRAIWEEKETESRPKIPFKLNCEWSWQMYLRDKLLAPEWNHRLLHWIVGRLGAEGKSTFADYFTNNFGGIYLSTAAGTSNIATVMHEHIKAGGSCKYIFIDLPRASKMHKMWDTLECLLNGKMTVMKYKGTTIRLGKPRVIVFSNWNPPFDIKAIKEARAANEKERRNPDLYDSKTNTYAESAVAIGLDETLSHDRWEIGDIFSTVDTEGNPDRIVTFRKNPFRTEYVKSTRFDHLPDDFY